MTQCMPASLPFAHNSLCVCQMTLCFFFFLTTFLSFSSSLLWQVFDDLLSLTTCHLNSIITSRYIPDWRYLLKNPEQGKQIIDNLFDHCWKVTYSIKFDSKCLNCFYSIPFHITCFFKVHVFETVTVWLTDWLTETGHHAQVLKEQFWSDEAWRSKTLKDASHSFNSEEQLERELKKHVCAGFNYPPSQYQLHLQFMLPPFLPFQYSLYLQGGSPLLAFIQTEGLLLFCWLPTDCGTSFF